MKRCNHWAKNHFFFKRCTFLLAPFSYVFTLAVETHIEVSVCSYQPKQFQFLFLLTTNIIYRKKVKSRIHHASSMKPSKEVLVEMVKRFLIFCYFRGSPTSQIGCSRKLSPVMFDGGCWCKTHLSIHSMRIIAQPLVQWLRKTGSFFHICLITNIGFFLLNNLS